MKTKILLCLLFLLLVAKTSFCQVATPSSIATDYLKKANSQTTSGVLLLIAGVGFGAATAATFEFSITQKVDNTASSILAIAGATSIVGGIILVKAGARNRKKARSISVKQGQLLLPLQGSLMTKTVPAIGLEFAF